MSIDKKISPAVMWDGASRMYNQMAKMEAGFTLNQIKAMPLLTSDTVLDCGCGPGRITVPVAKRVDKVTAMDCAEKMLGFCKENAELAGLTNVTYKNLEFNGMDAEKDIEKHDVVICSRSAGLSDLPKLTAMAKRAVVLVIWANSPTIPDILNEIFRGCTASEESSVPRKHNRENGYNRFFNELYNKGYEPNVSIVEDGFENHFSSLEEAYSQLITLREVVADKVDVFKENIQPYLTVQKDGSVDFLVKTSSAVIWWNVNKAKWSQIEE